MNESSEVYLKDCASPILLTVSPTYWSDCKWEDHRLKNEFGMGIPILYMSQTAHVFTSKNIFWQGFQAMKNMFCDHTCT